MVSTPRRSEAGACLGGSATFAGATALAAHEIAPLSRQFLGCDRQAAGQTEGRGKAQVREGEWHVWQGRAGSGRKTQAWRTREVRENAGSRRTTQAWRT
eukprot:8637077-Lingulodinium_polyedra.AAC.1